MICIVPANDSPEHLEHGLDLDRAVHDRVGTFAQCIGKPPGRATNRGWSGTNHHRWWWRIQSSKDLQQPLTTGLARTAVERDSEIDDGDVYRAQLQEDSGLFGGTHPEAIDSDWLQEPRQLLGEILTLPSPVTEHERQAVAFVRGSRLGGLGRHDQELRQGACRIMSLETPPQRP